MAVFGCVCYDNVNSPTQASKILLAASLWNFENNNKKPAKSAPAPPLAHSYRQLSLSFSRLLLAIKNIEEIAFFALEMLDRPGRLAGCTHFEIVAYYRKILRTPSQTPRHRRGPRTCAHIQMRFYAQKKNLRT